jgi:hypothetical protein
MQLHIPKPCTASWEDMTPEGNGRHCAACTKQVVDFTTMTDERVLQFLASAPGSLCGRMTGAQMQRDLVPVPPPTGPRPALGRRFLHYGLGALFALLAGTAGCDRRRLTGMVVTKPTVVKADTADFVLTGLVGRISQTYTVYLIVSDTDDKPIQGASVVVMGKKAAAVTDAQGKASFAFPQGFGRAALQVSAIGYTSKTVRLPNPYPVGDYTKIHVKLKLEEIIMGDIALPVQRINPG